MKHLNYINATARIARWVLSGILVVLVWKNAHWSVASAVTLLFFSLEGIAAVLSIQMNFIKAMRQMLRQSQSTIDEIASTLHAEADALKKELNTCRECEEHAKFGVRPGSVHNKNAENCLLRPQEKV